MADAIVKNLSFGNEAKVKIFKGIEQLTNAVSSTLGASGKCVIMEDQSGNPIITKDGVTVANSIILQDPIENMGATLLKGAARKTVNEAGDGTTTATVLAHAILNEAIKQDINDRDLKNGIQSAVKKVVKYLEKISTPVKGTMIDDIATISTNNDSELGKLIGDAFREVGETGIVTLGVSENGITETEIVDGIEYHKGYCHQNFITDQEKGVAELEKPLVLIIESKIESIRQIQPVLEYVIKNNKPLLIIGEVEPTVLSALVMNKLKGNIKINVVDAPAFGLRKKEILNDLALLTNSTIINEDLGDDLNAIQIDYLGECVKSISHENQTVIQVLEIPDEAKDFIENIKKDLKKKHPAHVVINLERRLARLSAKVAIVKVGAFSDVELKEKTDRVEDAICATKAAIKEGIVPGGGIALLNASQNVISKSTGETVLLEAIRAPFKTILANANITLNDDQNFKKGAGLNVVTGKMVNMVKSGIIDPLLVTKSALINAASVATTILSTDCVINNMRIDESNR
jgi:chaperonin GroEL